MQDVPEEKTIASPGSPLDDLSGIIDTSLQWLFSDIQVSPPALLPWISSMENSGLGNPSALKHIRHLHEQMFQVPGDRRMAAEMVVELRRFERAFLTAASHIDPLTGLRTRLDMMRAVEQEMARFQRSGTPFCIAVADIDHFKLINDTFGHDAGDRVLVAMADEISADIRIFDDAFRTGGEEFLICLKDVGPEDGNKTLERLRKNIETLAVDAGDGRPPVKFTISIGMSCAYDAPAAERLVCKADEALYKAKASGRNRVVCECTSDPNGHQI